MKQNQKHAKAM